MKSGRSFFGALLAIYLVPMLMMLLMIAALQIDTRFNKNIGKGISVVIGKGPIFATYSHAVCAYLPIAIIGALLALPLAPLASEQTRNRVILAALIGFGSSMAFGHLHWSRIHTSAHQPFYPWVIRGIAFTLMYCGWSWFTAKCLERKGRTQPGGRGYGSPAAGSPPLTASVGRMKTEHRNRLEP